MKPQAVVQADCVNPGALERSRLARHDYVDTFRVRLPDGFASDLDRFVWASVVSSPAWVTFLLRLRNGIVRMFGLKTGEGVVSSEPRVYEVGERVGLFLLYWRGPDEMLMGEQDKHLDFEVHVQRRKLDDGDGIDFSTLVHLKNRLGRGYFFFIKPFHRIIVKASLKRARKLLLEQRRVHP